MKSNSETATEWLEALKIENKEQQIQTSINQLKLPKKLLKQKQKTLYKHCHV